MPLTRFPAKEEKLRQFHCCRSMGSKRWCCEEIGVTTSVDTGSMSRRARRQALEKGLAVVKSGRPYTTTVSSSNWQKQQYTSRLFAEGVLRWISDSKAKLCFRTFGGNEAFALLP